MKVNIYSQLRNMIILSIKKMLSEKGDERMKLIGDTFKSILEGVFVGEILFVI